MIKIKRLLTNGTEKELLKVVLSLNTGKEHVKTVEQ
jgi:hypothetical protein